MTFDAAKIQCGMVAEGHQQVTKELSASHLRSGNVAVLGKKARKNLVLVSRLLSEEVEDSNRHMGFLLGRIPPLTAGFFTQHR